jgi:tRNA(Ile)-lysidine synthase
VRLLAAVSGGADSTAMLAALSRLREGGGFTLRAAHVEHGIRPPEESRGDARAVSALCAGLGLDCRVLSIRSGKVVEYARRRGTGIEAAARHFRYRALLREAQRCGAAAIVTAHTGDDALEMCLMRILRGSGPGGLGRMPPSRSITVDKTSLRILRPLLGLYRRDVESYLAVRDLPWRRDATNSDQRFFRNRIRAVLVPFLNGQFPGWKGALEALGDTQRSAADFIDAETRRRLTWEWKDAPAGGSGRSRGGELQSGGGFFDQPLIIREEALFQGLNLFKGPGSGAPVKRRNLRRFALGEIRDIDLGFCRAAVDRGRVSLFRGNGGGEAGFSLLIKGPGRYKLGIVSELGANSQGETVLKVSKRGKDLSAYPPEETGGFFAVLPLVLRPFYPGDPGVEKAGRIIRKDSAPNRRPEVSGMQTAAVPALCLQDMITAQDAAGAAALIGVSLRGAVILWKREIQGRGDFFFCGIGGIDAE